MAGKNKKTERKPKSALKKAKNDKSAKNANDKPVKEAGRKKVAVPVKEPAPIKETAPGKVAAKEPQDLAPEKSFYAVGIGASAGGLEAFEAFFRNMPPDSGMAFILVTHLDPKHKSMLTDLLRRYTQMSVYEAEEAMEVKPDTIYVIPPNKDMQIVEGRLYLSAPVETRGIRHPIDIFFRSLASDFREKAICIVLSGTGTEGTLGLRAVKEEGGLALAQKGAVYPGMPDSAVTTGLVDRVLPAEKMPGLLLQYAVEDRARPKGAENRTDLIRQILSFIRMHTGHDFSLYKQNTLVRRVERRMNVQKIKKLSDYVEFVKQNPYEADVLFRELLIRVTNFFRDPEAFKILEKEAFPLIFQDKPKDYIARFWVAGCSTGEEAYSLAILAHEYLNKIKKGHRVQLFATDIDAAAVETARNGLYPESVSVDVSPGRLEKYFMKREHSYKVKNQIREMVVFAVQDLTKDPPFSKLDLISCRNLLIYLGPELQRKVLPIFHYALNPGGILFLGSSETVGGSAEMFRSVDRKWKIFQSTRAGGQLPINVEFRRGYHAPEAAEEKREGPQPMGSMREMLNYILLQSYTPAGVLVNEEGNILYIHGRTGKFLEPAAGRASMNIIDMAREGLRLELQAALRKAARTKGEVLVRNLNVKTNGAYVNMDLEIRPMLQHEGLRGLLLVLFHESEKEMVKPAEPAISHEHKGKSAELEMELKNTKERLQTTIEELETSNEELKSSNEELQSSNEELQSTNEELETSREELQSVNEELVTVNTELQTKIDELAHSNEDMNNLLASTQIAIIFLDRKLKIKRFTPSITNLINLINTDIGRPLPDFVTKMDYPDLIKDCEQVLKELIPKEKAVRQETGLWYLVRIMPYRTLESMIDGVVLTFIDITKQQKKKEAEYALEYAESIFEAARESMLLLDRDLRIIKANSSFYNSIKLPRKKAEGKRLSDISAHQWNIPALMEQLGRVLAEDAVIHDYRLEYQLPDGGAKTIYINARKVGRKGEKGDTVLLSIDSMPVSKGK